MSKGSLVIINPDLVVCTILIFARVTQLCLIFQFRIHSLFLSFPMFQSQMGLLLAAAATGEALNDKQHETNVVAAGGMFYSFVVETFEIWSLFAVKTLKNIAARTTAECSAI